MTRTRAETAAPQLTVRNNAGPTPMASPAPTPGPTSAHPAASPQLPSIRFIPHHDPRAGRPSLVFPTITRTLPDDSAIIRVGRYSERDNLPELPTNAVGFKSKVVSRKHCELWSKDGSWYLKDVKSSSGTFLNHIRLSQPNVESKPFRIKDGDIIQLGIDFRGGEEMIFRCVKIRVECNRGWQQALNTFNKQTHQRLRNLAKTQKQDGDAASTHTSECAICLMSIAPCQSLFVAPCSHVWHYKCIRPILSGPTWPTFLCPNCRAVADLEEDVEEAAGFQDWGEEADEAAQDTIAQVDGQPRDRHVTPRASIAPLDASIPQAGAGLSDLQQAMSNMTLSDLRTSPAPQTPERQLSPAASSVTLPATINMPGTAELTGFSLLHSNPQLGPIPDGAPEGPITPRNDIGPFVLDGSGGRDQARRDPSTAGGAEPHAL